jgi:peroxiredoxin
LDLNSKIRFSDDDTKLRNIVQMASDMTKYAIAGYQRTDVSERVADEIPSAWFKQRERIIGMAYTNFGVAKFLTGDFDSALYYYNRSKKMLGDEYYLEADEAYYTILIKMGKNRNAFEEAKKALELGCANKELLHQALRVAADTPAMEKEADEIIGKDKSSSIKEREKEISRNFLSPPRDAIDFTLSDLNGNQTNLASLKGKIVILEFWDTYCGWCLKSFEKLQSFYNNHKNDKDLLFLTINTNPASKEKRETINRFLEENKFKFPVLFDEDNKVTSLYKIYGIPQTLVIGKNGKVYYKESGYGGPTIADDLEKVVAKINQAK